MAGEKSQTSTSRRKFLSSTTSLACLFCLGARSLVASTTADSTDTPADTRHRFLRDSRMTYEEVLKFAYASWLIPAMKVLAEDIGPDALDEMLRKITSEVVRRRMPERVRSLPDNSLPTFARIFEKPGPILENGAVYEIVENNERALELRVSECLWAKIFCDADAARIGFSYICFADYATAQAFNPGIVLHRSKTLMQGDDHCNHRYVMET
ncbi:MAG: L-2-amino-thiazoline-4-carboxylic acid hydrolase [Candidatus Zixiibacteriota bacterium]|nr:MAG: L-2-amino-thiazoline-4-carboxylic acid hydrolase [candidate division Zixibacteria bacterium]